MSVTLCTRLHLCTRPGKLWLPSLTRPQPRELSWLAEPTRPEPCVPSEALAFARSYLGVARQHNWAMHGISDQREVGKSKEAVAELLAFLLSQLRQSGFEILPLRCQSA